MRECAARADESGLMEHDRRLHHAIAAVMNNPRLQTELTTLSDSIQARGVLTIDRSRGMVDVAEEHSPIVEAIVQRDPDAAAARMEEHLVHTATLLMRQVATEGVDVVDPSWARDLVRYIGVPGGSDLR
ncbi:FCD domain-containing protein [Aeromicrobium sp. UC242_57]|uniref:FCD domain-containing protein n=1 Tax=Aeromicrobium sp. UC242_57 TaxID=3374624 RepID=UPI00379B20C9